MFANVIIDPYSRNAKGFYTYIIPKNIKNLEIGMRVLVPFNNTSVEGYIIKISEVTSIRSGRLKSIIRVLNDFSLFDEKMLELAYWMKDYYDCHLSESIQCMIPGGIKSGERKIKMVRLASNNRINIENIKAPRQNEVLKFLIKNNEYSLKDLVKYLGVSYSSIKSLEKKGFIKIYDKEILRYKNENIKKTYKLKPTKEQQYVIDTIKNSIENGKCDKYLLYGVTGSGKTEIYLQLIAKCIDNDRSAIVLVPEISLTPQTIERFVGRFGNLVAVLHSGLSQGERFDEWRKIKKGLVKVVVGVRNAIFAPLSNIGLIVIDEEHENTYKQSDFKPKYNVKEVAEKRCEIDKAVLILGSATPQIETYYKALNKEFKLMQLNNRIGISMPDVEIVNMSEELAKGNNSIFSYKLYNEIKRNLINGEQTILFLNRRGYSSFISCRDCGYVPKCPHCDISLTYHASEKKLVCHYCGFKINMISSCPKCKSKRVRYLGIGTERVEKDVKKLFPTCNVLRMDIDTTRTKGSHEKIFYDFKNGKADILIGTQMISKGFDIPNVTLVGVIIADITLNIPDFRSSEKTFQLLTQVAGRAGRGYKPGRVIIQTYEDRNYSIITAKEQNYVKFFNKEIRYRKIFHYPPFTHLMNILISGIDMDRVINKSKSIYYDLERTINKSSKIGYNKILGPSSAPIEKIKNNYRWQIIIKSDNRDILLNVARSLDEINIDRHVKVSFDIDPVNLL